MQPIPVLLAVDAVVFGYQHQRLQVLLIRRNLAPFEHCWALPGGFVRPGESLDIAVARELREETGIAINYLEQLYTFGAPDRDPRQRVVSVAWFALVNPEQFELAAGTDAAEAQWFPIDTLPDTAFDHADMIRYATTRLRNKLTWEPVGLNLLAPTFLFSDLEKLYECLLDRKIDRRNFRKKFLSFGILQEVSISAASGKGRPGALYRFDEAAYNRLKKQGIVFEVK